MCTTYCVLLYMLSQGHSFGPNVYLDGQGAIETISGVQVIWVMACAKHLVTNSQVHWLGSLTTIVNESENEMSLGFSDPMSFSKGQAQKVHQLCFYEPWLGIKQYPRFCGQRLGCHLWLNQ
jgi:hypothetical protein